MRTAPLYPRPLRRFQLQTAAHSNKLPSMRGDRIPFSHILPVVDLALLVVLVFVPITLTTIHLYEASAGSNQLHIRTGQFDVTLPRDQIIPWSIRIATVSKANTMKAIN